MRIEQTFCPERVGEFIEKPEIDSAINRAVAQTIDDAQAGTPEAVRQLCISRLYKYAQDVHFIIRTGGLFDKMLNVFCLEENKFQEFWYYQFRHERKILKHVSPEFDDHTQLSVISSLYRQWLKDKTTYAILFEQIMRNSPDRNPKSVKSDLKALFLAVHKLLKNKKTAHLTQVNEGTDVITYRDKLQKDRFSLLWVHKNEQNFLANGSSAFVWKAYDLANHRILALKQFKEIKEQSIDDIVITNNEHFIWELLTEDHPGLMSRPEITVKDEFLVGKRYKGDLIDFINDRPNYAFLTNQEILIGLLNALGGLCYMHSKKIAHRDIRIENLFFELLNKKTFNAVLSDFGWCDTFENIFNKKNTKAYSVGFKSDLDNKIFLQQCETNNRKEADHITEKQDIRVFGRTLFLFLVCHESQDSLPLSEASDFFIHAYGNDTFTLIKRMMDPDYRQRPTAQEAYHELQRITLLPQSTDPWLSNSFTYTSIKFYKNPTIRLEKDVKVIMPSSEDSCSLV